jgi:hypothetical protein
MSNIIDYIKTSFPKVVFNPINMGAFVEERKALGFIITDNKFVIGYIAANGNFCKVINPIDLNNIDSKHFIELLKSVPKVEGYKESDLTNFIKLMEESGKIEIVKRDQVITELQSKVKEFQEKEITSPNVLINSEGEKLLIKAEYAEELKNIKEKYEQELQNERNKSTEIQNKSTEIQNKSTELQNELQNEINDNQQCKDHLIYEKDIIIEAIKKYKSDINDYVIDSKNNIKENYQKIIDKLTNEKDFVETKLKTVLENEQKHLDNLTEGTDFNYRLEQKNDEIKKLNETILLIKNELDIIKEDFSKSEIQNKLIQNHQTECLEHLLAEKDTIIRNIKDYTKEWLDWSDKNDYSVEEYRKKLGIQVTNVIDNLNGMMKQKNEYVSSLNLDNKEKAQKIIELTNSIDSIKKELQRSATEQLTAMSLKDSPNEASDVESSDKLKLEIVELKRELEQVKSLLAQNNNTPIKKVVDYNMCFETFTKFVMVNNMFYRKKQVIDILDKIVMDPTVISVFTNLSERIQLGIKNRYTIIRTEIYKHIDFLNLSKYMNDPNVNLFKSKSTWNKIPEQFCQDLQSISEYWDANVIEYREQDRLLTNIFEDLSGALRIYIKIKPLIGIEQANNTVYIETVQNKKTRQVTVDCSGVPESEIKKQTFGDFYGIFDKYFTNLDVFTGVLDSKPKGEFTVDLDSIIEDSETINPGLHSSFKQVEDGYSIVLFGYGLSGSGKCQKIDTPIIMYDGTIKKVQDIIVGDLLMGDDSKARRVFSLARGRDIMYEVTNVKGESYTVNSEHILSLKYTGRKQLKDRPDRHSFILHWFNKEKIGFNSKTFSYKNRNKEDVEKEAKEFTETVKDDLYVDIPIKKYLSLSNHFKDFLKGYKVAVEFPHKDLEIDPYMIGFWLGDGTANTTAITTQDSTIIKYFKENLQQYKCYLQFGEKLNYRINGNGSGNVGCNYFMNILKKYNLINNKHIPHIYKCNSREQRLKLLAGILDADGSYDKKKRTFEFSQSLEHEQIMDDVIYLCRSLGFACYKNKKKTSWTYLGEKKYGEAWRISITGEGIEKIPTLCPRKQAEPRRQIKDVLVSGIKIRELPEDDYYGFEIDGNHHYLLGNFTVTHNTFTLLGQNGAPGLMHYGLANLKGVKSIRIKNVFEQYINKFSPTLKNISGNIHHLVGNIKQLKSVSVDETADFADVMPMGINLNNISIESLNSLTNAITEYRITQKRIKKTPNNPVSSRSHLYMVFEITFETGKIGYITIVDTAGRESPMDIYNLFIEPKDRGNGKVSKTNITTILGPTGGVGVVQNYMKESLKETYVPNDIYNILKEGFYINETINHLIYFFNKKNYKKTIINKQTSLDNYNTSKYYVDPRKEEDAIEYSTQQNDVTNALTIPIMNYLDNLSKSNASNAVDEFTPTKFICIVCVRTEEKYCSQVFATLQFAQDVRSS